MRKADTVIVGNDVKILSLVSAGHFVSHFYQYTLVALIIFFYEDLGLSYTLLGLIVSARTFAAGAAQIPAGFLVDRYGAKTVLIAGMLLMCTGYALVAFVSDYWLILLLCVASGIGDSVFHPANYSIMNGSVGSDRIGRAFSIHTFTGQLGYAIAPATVAYLCTLYGWRAALLIVAVGGYLCVFLLISQWSSLKDDVLDGKPRKTKAEAAAKGESLGDHARLLTSRPVMLLFAFFALSSLAASAVTGFSIPALHALHGTSAVDAGLAVGAFMLAASAAILIGGWISDNIANQDRFAAICYVFSTVTILAVALVPLHYVGLVLVLGAAGFFQGVTRTARDMMVREVAPKGSTGKVFGVIMTGQNVGGGLAPLILGAMLDHFPPQWVYYTSVFFTALCIVVVLVPRGIIPARAGAPAE